MITALLTGLFSGAAIGVSIMSMFNGASYSKGFEDGRNENR